MVALLQWWRGATVGTSLLTRFRGVPVGEDDQGNRYFRSKDGKRRWVLYKGDNDASRVPPEWHRWLHHTGDVPPSEQPPERKRWEKDHEPNKTGTPGAYFPPGSLMNTGGRRQADGDYEAWTPDQTP